jgi:erythromycin esterase-like protein
VIRYLERVDPQSAVRARFRYACFDHANEDPQAYGYAASFGLSKTCEDEAVQQLAEMQRHAADYIIRDGRTAAEALFYAEQNARLVKNAERYYRSTFGSRVSSWNPRDQHMADTLEALMQHLADSVEDPRIVVWAHNSHVGDARSTELGDQGELNIGQLTREYHGSDAVPDQFDAMVYIDETSALRPLESVTEEEVSELEEETFA